MNARALTVFVFLLLAGASWSASQQKSLSWNDQSTTLYQVYSTGGLSHMLPGFDGAFTSTLTIDSSKILSYGPGNSLDGAVVCPGATASLDSGMAANWAAPALYAYSAWWQPKCTPGDSSSKGGNFPVSWSKGDYEAIKDWNICYDNIPDCWGHEGALQDRAVDVYKLANSKEVTNKQGSIGVTCWGTRTPSATTPSGNYPGLSPSDSGASFHNDFALNTLGSYSIKDSYAVGGCAATVRQPVCQGSDVEEVFSRLSPKVDTSAPEYSKDLGSNAYSITVQNRQSGLSCSLASDEPMAIAAGGYGVVPVTITNTGNVANYVGGVSSDNPALAVYPFDGMLCAQNGGDRPSTNPECCANPPSCDSVPLNGVGPSSTINPGESRTVYVEVIVPPDTPANTYIATLSLSFSSSQNACNAPASQPLPCSMSNVVVNVGTPGSSGDSCNVTDGTMPIPIGTDRTFSLLCSHLTGTLGPCTGSTVTWEPTPPGFATLGANDYQSATINFPNAGTGDVTATVSGEFNATCKYSSNGQPVTVQSVVSCAITPPSANVPRLDVSTFGLACFDSVNGSVPCGTVAWALNGINGILFNTGPTGASVVPTSDVGATGQLVATMGLVSCKSDLTVSPPNTTLDINPPQATVVFQGTQPFASNCTANGVPVACTGVQWNPVGFPQVIGDVAPTTGPDTVYTATTDNISTDLWACAFAMTPPPCNFASITVGDNNTNTTGNQTPVCVGANCAPGTSPYCTIAEQGAGWYKVTCGAPGLTGPCSSTVNWKFNGLPFGTGYTVRVSKVGTLLADIGKGQTCQLDIGPNSFQCVEQS